ncbi:hypothetical protein ACQHIV_04605 [Kribbella sp. GL6]|uniref:hypothetical protein n=1 Tax=Kribbella sp. GL6 TaxID=3419765 RepID=UPI003D086966
MTVEVIRAGRTGRLVRLAVVVAGIGLLIHGTVRGTDDLWPFGPMSQYAMSVPGNASIDSIRVVALTDAGTTVDVPLDTNGAGIRRAEIEARTGAIVADPSLLQSVADDWARQHPDKPRYVRLELVRDTTTLVHGRVSGHPASKVLARWQVR